MQSDINKTLIPSDERLQLLKDALLSEDKDQLWDWIYEHFGVAIPRIAVCEHHCAPFDFVSDYLFNKFKTAVVLANRSGGKTFDFAILDTMMAYISPKTEIATVGAIQTQAQRCYGYFQGFSNQFPFGEHITKSSQKETSFDNESSVQVIVGTMAGVNSPHPQLLFLDEIDLMDWQIMQQAFSMPQSKNGVESRTVMTSTRKFPMGTMQRMMDEAAERKYKTYQWCIWEVVEKLPEDPAKRQIVFDEFKNELPENIDQADGYYSWDDVVSKHDSLDKDVWANEWLCTKPGLEGIIYGRSYSDDINLIGDFDPRDHKDGQVWLFEDFGFGEGHPDVCLFAWIPPTRDKIIIFDELYMIGYNTDMIWQAIDNKLIEYGHRLPNRKLGISGTIAGWIGDPHGHTEKEDRKYKGAPMVEDYPPEFHQVNDGINLLKRALEREKVLLSRKCQNLRFELLSYKRKKALNGLFSAEPEKKNDHGLDALRYGAIFFRNLLFRVASAIMKTEKKVQSAPAPYDSYSTGGLTEQVY